MPSSMSGPLVPRSGSCPLPSVAGVVEVVEVAVEVAAEVEVDVVDAVDVAVGEVGAEAKPAEIARRRATRHKLRPLTVTRLARRGSGL